MISHRKRIIFSLIILTLPLMVIILLEISLRWLTPSLQPPLVSEVSYDNIEWYRVNRGYLKKYFPLQAKLIPEFKPTLFRKQKSDSLYRIICLGGSTLFGTPYQMTSNIPGILKKQLSHLYPHKEIEVINFGASAINSQVIRQYAPQLLAFQPDLVLIYMGHNEFYGPDGVGSTFLEKRFPVLLRLKYTLRKLSLYQMIRNGIESVSSGNNTLSENNLMREVSRGSEVKSDSEDARRIFRIFRENLAGIIEVYQEKGIPVIVSDIASNLQFPPFAYPPQIGGQPSSQVIETIEKQLSQGNYPDAFQQLQAVRQQDSTHAMIEFLTGRTCLLLAEPVPARYYFRRAVDEDLLKFRAPGKINDIIREVCDKKGIPVIEAEDHISQISQQQVSGYDLFWEHLHLKTEGYYAIAGLFLDRIIAADLITPAGTSSPLKAKLPMNTDSLDICWLDVAYADLSIGFLTGKWPFQNFQAENRFLHKEDRELQNIVKEVYQKKIVWDEGCYRTAFYFEKMRRFSAAATTYRAVIQVFPFNFYAHYQLARLNKDRGRLADAVHHYQMSIRSNGDYPYSRLELGMVQINLGMFDQAILNLQQALTLFTEGDNPAQVAAILYGLAAANANKGNYEIALDFADRSLKSLPTYTAAQDLRRGILQYLSKQKSDHK